MQILVKNLILDQQSKFWSEIEMLVDNQNLVENQNFGRKSKKFSKINFFSKIKILVENQKKIDKLVNFNFFSTSRTL